MLWFDWQSESSASNASRCAVVDEANDNAARLLGAQSAAELRGLPLSGLFARESWPAIERELAAHTLTLELLGRGAGSVRARARLLAPGQMLQTSARTLLVCPAGPKSASSLVCRRLSRGLLHDLRSPMMAISGFADVLTFRHSAELGPDARRCVENIAAAAQRMERMVELLASETRLGSGELELHPIDLRELLRGLALEAGVEPPAAHPVGELPLVSGDRPVLRAAFAELFALARGETRIELAFGRERARVRIAGAGAPAEGGVELLLARRAFELHGGQLGGEPPVFEVELPLRRGAEAGPA
jgi:signal transduction histidine kinase